LVNRRRKPAGWGYTTAINKAGLGSAPPPAIRVRYLFCTWRRAELLVVAPLSGHSIVLIELHRAFATTTGVFLFQSDHAQLFVKVCAEMLSSDKIAVFIDGANLYATAKTLGFDIDHKRLLEEFQSRGTLLRPSFYTAIAEDQEYTSLRPLIDWLDYNGFTVVTKAAKEFWTLAAVARHVNEQNRPSILR
jgi:hypothetical protein